GVSVLVNGLPHDTNVLGKASFMTPNTAAVTLSLKRLDDQEPQHLDYALTPDGLLCWSKAGSIVQKVVPQPFSRMPQLLYAPAVIEPGQTISLLGTAFDGRPDIDRVYLDGNICEVLAGSSSALLVHVPDHLQSGSFKQIYVGTTSGDT